MQFAILILSPAARLAWIVIIYCIIVLAQISDGFPSLIFL
nr:MAG TPA: hypothetical protein [Caudoviricetes sp.]